MGHNRYSGACARIQQLTARNTALAVCIIGLMALVVRVHHQRSGKSMSIANWSSMSAGPWASCYRDVKPLPFVENRDALGRVLEEEGMAVGIELGVQRGLYTEKTLSRWTKCKHMTLVDVWAQLPNYSDQANKPDEVQAQLLREAHGRLDKFAARGTTLEFLQMLTKDAAPTIPNSSVDFVYVDARHDFCGVMEDIELYWPKLREGGIMAGHDYVREETWKNSGQDWALCEDGSRNPLAVLGAVNQFAAKHELQVVVPPFDETWKSWMIRKPSVHCPGTTPVSAVTRRLSHWT